MHLNNDLENGASVMLEYLTLKDKDHIISSAHSLESDLRNLLDRCSRVTFWNPDEAKEDITLGHLLKHEMCTYIVKLLDKKVYSYKWIDSNLEYLKDLPTFPHEKLSILRRNFHWTSSIDEHAP